MANYENLKTAIASVVKTNGNQEITGALMQQTLFAIVNAVRGGYLFAGPANAATNPGTPDQNVFYLASTPGTYANFGGIELGLNEVALLLWNGSWRKGITDILNSNAKKLDNFEAISRAAITFPATNQVAIGNGYIYFRKGGALQYSKQHTETTYTFTGHQFLCFDYVSNGVQVKSTPGDTDLVLFWHDNVGGIRGGLLYGYYLLAEIEKATAAVGDNFNAVSRAPVTFPAVNVVKIGDGYIYIRKGNEVFETLQHTETTYTFTGTGFLCYNLVSHTLVQRSSIEENDVVMLWYDGGVGFRAGLLILEWIIAQGGGGGGDVGSKDNMTLVSRAPVSFPETNQVKIGTGYIYLKKGSSFAQTITISQEVTYTFATSQMLCYNLSTHVIAQKSAPEENDVILLWFDGGVLAFRAGLLYDEYLRQLADSSGLPPMDYVLPNTARPDDTLQPVVHGATQYYPQNTAGLFRLASRNRLNFWECDVRPCLDGYVLAHNDDMAGYALTSGGSAISAGTWLCSQKTVAQLKTLKTGILPNTTALVDGFENETVLTFEEFIVLAKTYNAVPVIELKFGATQAQIAALYATCEKHGVEQKVIWICYGGRFTNADYIVALNPDAYIMFAFYPPDEQIDMKTNLDTCATYLHKPGHIFVSMPWDNWDDVVSGVTLIDYAHTLKLRCATWSASNSTYVAQIKAGVCNIETDMYYGLMDNAFYYLQKYSQQIIQ